ncbi:hypothetical protein [Pseudomonas sp. LRF_L74]|uniref:hypothetical protein n=1 Tax=Pseudomonas sp. LRF_L74 TaxID=3369422 RepID=UPI003F61C34A
MSILFLVTSCLELLLACITYRSGLPRFALAIAMCALSAQALHQLALTGLGFVALFAGLGLILSSMKVIDTHTLDEPD